MFIYLEFQFLWYLHSGVSYFLIRSIANAIDDTAIKAAIRKIRSYDSREGNEAEMLLFVSDSINTWFACINVPAITGPTEAPIR